MIEKEMADKIIDNIGKYLQLDGKYDAENGLISATVNRTFDARTLKTITLHYDVRSFINVSKTMNKRFELVIFRK